MTPIQKYIQEVYSKDSKLNKIEDIQERKKIAAEKCEIEIPENTPELRKQIIEFLRSQAHNKFSLLITKEELLFESLEIMREPLIQSKDDDKRLKNLKLKGDANSLCDQLAVQIEALRIEIFTDEFHVEAKKVISIEERIVRQRFNVV